MEQERQEVYERIPWETLEKGGGDRQWLVYAVAGAVVLGALAYSFVKNQPTAPPPPEAVPVTSLPPTPTTSEAVPRPSTVTSPIVVAEADLYAVDPEALADRAAGHAEWFAVEYVAYDGSERSAEVLGALLPGGLPAPEAPEGTQVFVDWAGVLAVTQVGPVAFEVDVLVRSLVATGDSGFTRQTPLLLTVEVAIGEDGEPRVAGAPTLATAETGTPADSVLARVPDEIVTQLATDYEDVIGGVVREDGSWAVVVVIEGSDGVSRPVTIDP